MNEREELKTLMREVRDDVDYDGCTQLIDEGELDSLDLFQIVLLMGEHYSITIPASEITPQNFNSLDGILALINRLKSNE